MLNKEQSKKMNAFKSLFILPLLAIFLVSFNTEDVYEFSNSAHVKQEAALQSIELIIKKTTTNEQLEKMKNDLAKDDIDFSYTTVRNDNREIIDISVQISGKGANGATFTNSHSTSDSNNGISPLVIFIDRENNLVSIGTKGAHKPNISKISSGRNAVWISSDDENPKEIIVKEEDGKSKIYIDGEEVDEEELHPHAVNVLIGEDENHSDKHFSFRVSSDEEDEEDIKHVKIKKRKSGKRKQVMIIKDSDDDSDIEVIDSDQSFFFIDNDGKEPLYIIDGKEATKKEVKKLSPKKIATIDVSKGEAAIKKYGNKAKDGVVEIITKEKN